MKKHIVAIVLIAGLTMATAASAYRGRGGDGYGDCPQMQGPMMQGPMMQQLDPETQAKVTKFFKDNQPLHKQIAMKQAEKRALMQNDKPDPQAAAKVAGELFDLRTAMHDKAEAAGVAQYLGPMGGGKGLRGPGRGFGGRPGMDDMAPQQ
jgi:Spy/CpxP family protein refolding chaperone